MAAVSSPAGTPSIDSIARRPARRRSSARLAMLFDPGTSTDGVERTGRRADEQVAGHAAVMPGA